MNLHKPDKRIKKKEELILFKNCLILGNDLF